MKQRIATILSVAIFILGVGVAWHAGRNAELTDAEHATLVEKRRQLLKALRQAAQRRMQAETLWKRREARLTTTPSKPLKPVPALPAPDFQQILSAHPELQNLQFAARRAQLFITYGPLYRKLDLTPAQIDRFENNVLHREEQVSDLFASARAQGLPNTDPALGKLLEKTNQDYQAAQRALLGESSARQLDDYERLAGFREIASGLAGAAAMAGTPLTAGQAEQFAHTLAAANIHDGASIGMPMKIDWNIVSQQAQSFLSPDQLIFIETTEPRGPRGVGGRFLPTLHAVISQAAAEDAKAQTGAPAPTP